MANKTTERKEGFYWVERNFYWTIAEWCKRYDGSGFYWSVLGFTCEYVDTDFEKIDERQIVRAENDSTKDNETEELKQLVHNALPDECIEDSWEIKFCPNRLSEGNKCKKCSDYNGKQV